MQTLDILAQDKTAFSKIAHMTQNTGLDVTGAQVIRTSSRFCFGVEHGDYNGTELFGIGTDRFIWLAYKPNNTNRVRLFSGNFESDGIVEFEYGCVPAPRTVAQSWARFPYGVEYILRKNGFALKTGFDAVLYGNIPGGGMSRSASLTINLISAILTVNGLSLKNEFQMIELAQAVENEYIGSPCGQLDQIMVYFAKDGMGTHFDPRTKKITYIPLGSSAADFRIVGLDTGTVRPGLEKSTYKKRRTECDDFVEILKSAGYKIACLADIRDDAIYNKVMTEFGDSHPAHCSRLKYIYKAQQRFYNMLEYWKAGDIAAVGALFRADGLGLRDEYVISGPELETMCDIARTVPGVYGERMLGGGDKGVSGAIVSAQAVDQLKTAVEQAYPLSHPDYAGSFAVNSFRMVSGVNRLHMPR
jgi:galactokinase